MTSAFLKKLNNLDLDLDPSSLVRTITKLRSIPMARFEPLLTLLYPLANYINPIKTKYVFIYLVQESIRKDMGGIDIDLDRLLNECETKADILLENFPYIDFMLLPDYDPDNTIDYPERKKLKTQSVSMLKQIKQFCEGQDLTDRKLLVKKIIEEFDIDKAKANTYVHLYLRDTGVIPPSDKEKIPGDKQVSALKQVKAYVNVHQDTDRKILVTQVMGLFNLNKSKANTYVHLSLKDLD